MKIKINCSPASVHDGKELDVIYTSTFQGPKRFTIQVGHRTGTLTTNQKLNMGVFVFFGKSYDVMNIEWIEDTNTIEEVQYVDVFEKVEEASVTAKVLNDSNDSKNSKNSNHEESISINDVLEIFDRCDPDTLTSNIDIDELLNNSNGGTPKKVNKRKK